MLLLRERLLFWAPLNLNEGRRTYRETERIDLARLVRMRVGCLLQGDWQALLAKSHATAAELRRKRKDSLTVQRDESYLADAVLRKAMSEEYLRAVALLASPGLAAPNEETITRFQELLQPKTGVALAPQTRPGPGPPLFSAKLPRSLLRFTQRQRGRFWRKVGTLATSAGLARRRRSAT